MASHPSGGGRSNSARACLLGKRGGDLLKLGGLLGVGDSLWLDFLRVREPAQVGTVDDPRMGGRPAITIAIRVFCADRRKGATNVVAERAILRRRR